MKTYELEVKTVWDDGTVSVKPAPAAGAPAAPGLTFSVAAMLPGEFRLTEIGPIVEPRFNFSQPFTFAGKKYTDNIAGWLNTSSDYDLKGLFTHFTAIIGIDDATEGENADKEVEFIIKGDGKELWKSGPMKKADSPKNVEVDISGIKVLTLTVTGPQMRGYGRGGIRAGWADPVVRRGK